MFMSVVLQLTFAKIQKNPKSKSMMGFVKTRLTTCERTLIYGKIVLTQV